LRLRISLYREEYRKQWEDFIEHAANGTFLQRRSFMKYHGDRFEDASLMVWEGEMEKKKPRITRISHLPAAGRN
jgi:hypothetical protein